MSGEDSGNRTNDILRLARKMEQDAEAILLGIPSSRMSLEAADGSHKNKKSKLDRSVRLAEALEVARSTGEEVAEAQSLIDRVAEMRWDVALSFRKFAFRFSSRGLGLASNDDVHQLAMIGLYGAANRFDPDRGIKFGTYAKWWMMSMTQKELVDSGEFDGTMRVSRGVREKVRIIRRLEGSGATRESIADSMGISVREVDRLKSTISKIASIDAPLEEGSDLSLADALASPSPEEGAFDAEDIKMLDLALDELSARERQILVKRYGLVGDADPMSLSAVGHSIGLGREGVRQIERGACRKLLTILHRMRGNTGDSLEIYSHDDEVLVGSTEQRRGDAVAIRHPSQPADESVGKKIRERRWKAGQMSQKALARLVAPILKRSPIGVQGAISILERRNIYKPALLKAIHLVLDREEAEAGRLVSTIRMDKTPTTIPADSTSIDSRGTESMDNESGRTDSVLGSSDRGAACPDRDLASRSAVSSSLPVPASGAVRLHALLDRCGVPVAPLQEGIGWRIGWFEHSLDPDIDFEPLQDDGQGRVDSLLSRLGAPRAPAGEDSSWRAGWLEWKASQP